MTEVLLRSWRILALRGVIAIAFGVLTLLWPGLTLLALAMLFAVYALLEGIVSVSGAVKYRNSDDHWWLPLLFGIVSIGAGIIAIIHPALTVLVLVLLMGANALVCGIIDIEAAIRLRKVIQHEWLLMLSGLVSVVFGILVFLFPATGALALIWLISIYALVTGVLLLGLAFRLRARTRVGTGERRVNPDRRISARQPRPV